GVVDRVDRDSERPFKLIVTAVGRAAVVVKPNREGGRAVGVGGRGVGQLSGGVQRRRHGEQRRVAYDKDAVDHDCLARLVGGARPQRRPACYRLQPTVLVDRRRVGRRDARRVIHRGDGDDERLRRRGIHAAVGRAAVVLEDDGDGGGAVGVGGRRVRQ